MNIALAQINPIVGDLAANVAQIRASIEQARRLGAEVLITPEMALTSYALDDLLLRPALFTAVQQALDELLEIDGITLVIGYPEFSGGQIFSSAIVFRDGHILGRYQKMLLQNEGIFDEVRYFSPGFAPFVFEVAGVNIGLLMASDLQEEEPIAASIDEGAQCLCVLASSIFTQDSLENRQENLAKIAKNHQIPILYCNAVGGQDEFIFEGASFAVHKNGKLAAQAPAFREDLLLLSWKNDVDGTIATQDPDPLARLYQALVFALREYVHKNGFPSVVLGMSGGMDSALVLALAVDALGARRVRGIMMPSPFTADISLIDARAMMETLKVAHETVPIAPLQQAFDTALAPLFAALPQDTTEENIQARLRGMILMAISNKTGALLLTTGNKSELAVGYCTLYGDMAGGFAPIKDVPKTLVYALAKWRNAQSAVIPERIITRPPSAELRPDQTDQDSLPPYEILDAILHGYVVRQQSPQDLIAQGFTAEDVQRVVGLINGSEYKRKQSVIGPKVTARAFGRDWRMPLTKKINF